METQLTGVMDDLLVEELQRVAQWFLGKHVKIVIAEFNGNEKSSKKKSRVTEGQE